MADDTQAAIYRFWYSRAAGFRIGTSLGTRWWLPLVRSVAATIAFLMVSIPSHADLLPPAMFFASSGFDFLFPLITTGQFPSLSPTPQVFSSTAVDAFGTQNSFAVASNNLAPLDTCPGGPTACVYAQKDVSVRDLPSQQPDLGVTAFLTYSFLAKGPPGISVPLLISGQAGTDFVGGGTRFAAFAGATVRTGDFFNNPVSIASVCTNNHFAGLGFEAIGLILGPCLQSEASFHYQTQVQSNTIQTLFLEADASVSPSDITADLSVRAWADPSISIDPTFPLADQFTILTSDGITNPAPASVPEPSTLILFGSALIGFWGLRPRRAEIMTSTTSITNGGVIGCRREQGSTHTGDLSCS